MAMPIDSITLSRKQAGGMFSTVDVAEQGGVGQVWWVGSTHTNALDTAGHGRNPESPFATWVYAVSQALASPSTGDGDTIYLLPGHAETIGITGAAAITLNIPGLRTIGLGGRTRRPAILVDGFNDTYVSITGADTSIENVTFNAGHADIVSGMIIAAAGVEILGCGFAENVAGENFLGSVLTTAAADDLVFSDNMIITVDTNAKTGIEIAGACDRVIMERNFIKGPFDTSCMSAITNACLEMQIHGNRLMNTLAGDDLAGCIDLVAASTGMATHNDCYMEDATDILTALDLANLGSVENYVANEYGEVAGYHATPSA
jgi:hypothetical protein